jgi:acyl-coenzyme A thioesterase PaaI-like protein
MHQQFYSCAPAELRLHNEGMSETPVEPGLPQGFEPHFRKSPLTEPWEPLFFKRDGDWFHLGVRIATPHTNARGLAHGALISALADNAMGLACVQIAEGASALTAHLALDYLGVVRIGEFMDVAARPTKIAGALAFAEATVTADGRLAARASAIFSLRTKPAE